MTEEQKARGGRSLRMTEKGIAAVHWMKALGRTPSEAEFDAWLVKWEADHSADVATEPAVQP